MLGGYIRQGSSGPEPGTLAAMASPAHPPGTVCWIELASKDADASAHFYAELLGWSAERVPMPGDAPGEYRVLKLDGHTVAGLHELRGAERELPSHWAAYVASADVEADAAKVEAAGGELIHAPMEVPGVGRMAVFRDAEGAALSLFEPGERGGFALRERPGAYCWSELYTKDPEAAGRFYAAVLGWRMKSDEGEDMPYYEFATKDGTFIAGMLEIQSEWGPVPPHWQVYLQVASLDVALERVRALGGQVYVEAKTVEEVGRFASICDPTGARVSLIEMAR